METRRRLYLNSNPLIRAVDNPKAKEFLLECCRRHQCVVSSVHWLERWKPKTIEAVRELLEELGVEVHAVDVDALAEEAYRLTEERGWSPKRRLDLMHVLAAVELGCHGIVAVDRFIRRRAKEYGLLYVNTYTGCP